MDQNKFTEYLLKKCLFHKKQYEKLFYIYRCLPSEFSKQEVKKALKKYYSERKKNNDLYFYNFKK